MLQQASGSERPDAEAIGCDRAQLKHIEQCDLDSCAQATVLANGGAAPCFQESLQPAVSATECIILLHCLFKDSYSLDIFHFNEAQSYQ